MRALKRQQYLYRYSKFQETFESTFTEGSREHRNELGEAFEKALNEEGILMPDWIC